MSDFWAAVAAATLAGAIQVATGFLWAVGVVWALMWLVGWPPW